MFIALLVFAAAAATADGVPFEKLAQTFRDPRYSAIALEF